MICTSKGCRVETSPFTSMRASRSLRCAARYFLRIFFRTVTDLTGEPAEPATAPSESLCHTSAVPRGDRAQEYPVPSLDPQPRLVKEKEASAARLLLLEFDFVETWVTIEIIEMQFSQSARARASEIARGSAAFCRREWARCQMQ